MADERFDTVQGLQDSLVRSRMKNIPIPKGDSDGRLRFDAADVLDSLPDAFALRAGIKIRQAHPLAAGVSEMSWPRLGKLLQCRTLVSSDFGSALAVGFRQIVASAYSSEDDCSACFLDSVTKNFQPAAFPVVDTIDLQEQHATGNGIGSIPLQILSTIPGELGQVQSYRARVLISRQLLISDDFALVNSLIRHLSAHAARLPAQRLGGILAANANLVDGAPLCGSSNTTAASGYSLTTLAEGAGKLRAVTSATGNTMNLRPSVWLVPAAGEIPAKSAVRQIELAGQSTLQVVVNPWAPAGYSYLLASPDQQPTFIRLLLDQPPLRPIVSQGNLPLPYDGVALDVDFSFGVQAVSRLGIVRIATA